MSVKAIFEDEMTEEHAVQTDEQYEHFEVYNETWRGEEMIQKMFGGWGDNGQ